MSKSNKHGLYSADHDNRENIGDHSSHRDTWDNDKHSNPTTKTNNNNGPNARTSPYKKKTNADTYETETENNNNNNWNKYKSPSRAGGGGDTGRLVDIAQQILQTLSPSQIDDMVQILSDFDNRIAIGLHQSAAGSSENNRLPPPQPAMDPSPHHSLMIPAEKIISQWDVDPSNDTDLTLLWFHRREEIPAYLQATDDLHDLIQTLSQISSSSSASSASFDHDCVTKRQNDDDDAAASMAMLDHAQNLMQSAMFRLEAEFRHLLTYHSKTCTDPAAMSDFLASGRSGHPRSSFGDLAMDGFDSFVDRSTTITAGKGPPNPHAKTGHGDGDGGGEDKQETMATTMDEDSAPSAFPLEAMIPADIAADLCDIAARMLRSGYGMELAHIYVSVRKAAVEESMHRAIMQGSILNSAEGGGGMFEAVQRMPWQDLQAEIAAWISAMKLAVGLLFPGEKRLCHYIFGDHRLAAGTTTTALSCFVGIAKTSMLDLLSFADAVAITECSHEKLFKILDMYECLHRLIPAIGSLFAQQPPPPQQQQQQDGHSTGARGSKRSFGTAGHPDIPTEASETLGRLGNAARITFSGFESMVLRPDDPSKMPVSDRGRLRVVEYVMNYLRFLSDFMNPMNQLLWERNDDQTGGVSGTSRASSGARSRDDIGGDQDFKPLSLSMLRLMEALEKKLDAKSKLYKDLGLSCLFLMNHLHYIGQKVKSSDLRKLLGDEWIKKNNVKLKQYHTTYRRTWANIVTLLKEDGLNISRGSTNIDNSTRNLIKDKFKAFNTAFEENLRTHSGLLVSDHQLCVELTISVTAMILPAYRAFHGRFHNHLDMVKHKEKYVKYTPEDLESHLSNLFEKDS